MTSALDFRFHPYNDHGWISGTGDSGKTKYMQFVLIPFFIRMGYVFVVYDYNCNYGNIHGLPVTSRIDILQRYLYERKSIIFQSANDNDDEDFRKFCVTCRQFQNVIIIFEEIQEFLRSKLSMPPWVSALVKTGRNWKRTYFCITQRPQEVPTALYANARHKWLFKVDFSVPSDKEWMVKAVGESKALELEQAKDFSYGYKYRNGSMTIMPPIKKAW